MSKSVVIFLALIAIIGSFLVIRYAKDSYKLLPIDEKNPLPKENGNFENWREFSNPDNKFKILFPVIPQHIADKIADPITKEPRKFDMFAAADTDGTAFMLNTTTFPVKVENKDIETLLRNVVNDMLARNKENKLKSSKMGKFHGKHAMDFAFENGEVTVAGKAILHDNTLYVLSMVDQTHAFKMTEFNFFLNSFETLDSNSKNWP